MTENISKFKNTSFRLRKRSEGWRKSSKSFQECRVKTNTINTPFVYLKRLDDFSGPYPFGREF